MATLDAQLAKVRSQLNSQVEATHRAAQLLVAVEDTLQQTDAPAQAYWVALTATLNQLATDPQAAKPATEKRNSSKRRSTSSPSSRPTSNLPNSAKPERTSSCAPCPRSCSPLPARPRR